MLVPPSITLAATTSSQSIIENTTVILDCHVIADPQPSFIWYKNGKEINTTYASTSSHSSQIMLRNISTIDAGNYTCFSQNIVGNVTSKSITIIVYCKFINVNLN